MKKTFAMLLFVSVILAVPAWGQEKIKIGLIDVQKAISESQAGQKARGKFQAQVKKVEGELLKEKQEAERLKEDLDKKGPLMKADERRNLEKEVQRRALDYQRNMRDSQEELRRKEGEMTAEILKDLEKVVTELGKNEKYTLIFERTQVIYFDEAMDITEKVIDLYNNRALGKGAKGK